MDTFQSLGTPNRSRFGVFKLSKPKRLRARHGLPHRITEGSFVYRAISELDVDGAWGTWLGEQRNEHGARRAVLLKHTGDSNRTRAGADALWLEALLTCRLEGPQVVPLVDYGVLDGRPFAVYDFEEGVFLAQVLEGLRERREHLPSAVAVGVILQASELIARLHELRLDGEQDVGGFVHGSLCPRNFVLTGRGDVRVMGLVGVRPVGRVVGREHVPAAAVDYASPDLLGGAPVTPAVDVYSLSTILSELLADPSQDELGRQVRGVLAGGPSRFSTVRAFAGALQDAVRRTGTVVARQSIAAQVREICDHYLLERRRQVLALLATPWQDEKDSQPASGDAFSEELGSSPVGSFSGSGSGAAMPAANGRPGGVVSFGEVGGANGGAVVSSSAQSPGGSDGAVNRGPAMAGDLALSQYDEEVSDDAVTRFMDGSGRETDAGHLADSAVSVGATDAPVAAEVVAAVGRGETTDQTQAWMHDSAPPEAVRARVSWWAVGGLMGVLVAICSIAAIVAGRTPAVDDAQVNGASAEVAVANAGAAEMILAGSTALGAKGASSETASSETADSANVADSEEATSAAEGADEAVGGVEEEAAPQQGDEESSPAQAATAKQQSGLAAAVAQRRGGRKAPASARRPRAGAKRGAPTVRKAAPSEPREIELPGPSGPTQTASVLELPESPAPGASEIAREMGPDEDLEIEEKPKMAYLSVDASPYADVYIDGKKAGVTPIVRMELAPGPHRMVARNADGDTKRYTLMLQAGSTETVRITW